MAKTENLASKYRPKTWNEMVGQSITKTILDRALKTGRVNRTLLFTGPAGCGKTTSARIFASMLEEYACNIFEINAADQTRVEDMRAVIESAKTKPVQGKMKIYILDECHMLSNSASSSLLKILEEPPEHVMFILCTTDPQKILPAIASRLFRYNFQKISIDDIVFRLNEILTKEKELTGIVNTWDNQVLEYIAQTSQGGMRDAITLLDKCLSYSENLTIENAIQVIGATNYDSLFLLLDGIVMKNEDIILSEFEKIYRSGVDLKFFIKNLLNFTLDINKYITLKSFDYINIPKIYSNKLMSYNKTFLKHFISILLKLNSDLKWETNPKIVIESTLLLETL